MSDTFNYWRRKEPRRTVPGANNENFGHWRRGEPALGIARPAGVAAIGDSASTLSESASRVATLVRREHRPTDP
jgi:hypothetical protein